MKFMFKVYERFSCPHNAGKAKQQISDRNLMRPPVDAPDFNRE